MVLEGDVAGYVVVGFEDVVDSGVIEVEEGSELGTAIDDAGYGIGGAERS